MTTRPSSSADEGTPTVAVVLSGAAARGAFQAGALAESRSRWRAPGSSTPPEPCSAWARGRRAFSTQLRCGGPRRTSCGPVSWLPTSRTVCWPR
jgi:hypothetical protein